MDYNNNNDSEKQPSRNQQQPAPESHRQQPAQPSDSIDPPPTYEVIQPAAGPSTHTTTTHTTITRIPLLNSRALSQGFSTVYPGTLPTVPHATWQAFIEEVNKVLRKAPGHVSELMTEFWLANLATLGFASKARDMYAGKVQRNAAEVLERWNAGDLGAARVRARFARAAGDSIELIIESI